ncbi:hypothetical protein ONE63_001388 [Megalurothrips usitatus]|uniref:Uncharacterized protein n=1 Tax=Megalurothrips usitatus TaxID=439358 RepID=A0AAV7XG20_9NEOP|nr:hypothetical protein ONE63_001388 [Megalurothrips usitatus]
MIRAMMAICLLICALCAIHTFADDGCLGEGKKCSSEGSGCCAPFECLDRGVNGSECGTPNAPSLGKISDALKASLFG